MGHVLDLCGSLRHLIHHYLFLHTRDHTANAYRASKTFAEKAAWEFIEREHPCFDLVTINPPLVLGPVVPYLDSLDDINTSNARIRDMIQGKCKERLSPSLGVYLWADVRDVALAHVRAAEVPEALGFFCRPSCEDHTMASL
jgi:nucleoside-diphosphate-sugar epimerase